MIGCEAIVSICCSACWSSQRSIASPLTRASTAGRSVGTAATGGAAGVALGAGGGAAAGTAAASGREPRQAAASEASITSSATLLNNHVPRRKASSYRIPAAPTLEAVENPRSVRYTSASESTAEDAECAAPRYVGGLLRACGSCLCPHVPVHRQRPERDD